MAARFQFLDQTRSLPCVSRTRDPTTTTTTTSHSHTPPPYPYAPFCVAVSHGAPETEPQRLGFAVLAQIRSLPRISRTRDPTTITTSHTPPRHPYAPSRTVLHCHFTRRTRSRAMAARFHIFGPNPLPASHFANARPRHHHHLVRTPNPPVRTVPCCRFARRARNRATAARFFVSPPNPPPPCMPGDTRLPAPQLQCTPPQMDPHHLSMSPSVLRYLQLFS